MEPNPIARAGKVDEVDIPGGEGGRLPIAICWRPVSLDPNQEESMLNQLTQNQKYGVYAFAAGVLTVIAFLVLAR